MIEYCTVVILYIQASDMGSWQYMYIDLFIIVPLSFTMSRTGAYRKLDKSIPPGYLISAGVLLSVICQILIQVLFQIGMFLILRKQSWFVPVEPESDHNTECFENTTLFYMSLTQYIIVVLAFNVGKPFRKPIYTNWLLCISLIVTLSVTYFIILVG